VPKQHRAPDAGGKVLMTLIDWCPRGKRRSLPGDGRSVRITGSFDYWVVTRAREEGSASAPSKASIHEEA